MIERDADLNILMTVVWLVLFDDVKRKGDLDFENFCV